MKTKELIKRALRRPELFTEGELLYLKMVKKHKKQLKKKAKKPKSDYLS